MAVFGVGHEAGSVDTSPSAIIGWKLRYEDGSIVTSRQTTWALAPAVGVQTVQWFLRDEYDELDANGKSLPRKHFVICKGGFTHYWYVEELMYGWGEVEEVPLNLPAGALKTGTTIDIQSFRDIYNTAQKDRAFNG